MVRAHEERPSERCVSQAASPGVDKFPRLLALGIVSAPSNAARRSWIRQTVLSQSVPHAPAKTPSRSTPSRSSPSHSTSSYSTSSRSAPLSAPPPLGLVADGTLSRAAPFAAWFVLGTLGLGSSLCDALISESRDQGDVLLVDAHDNDAVIAVGCVDKTFAWYSRALSLHPRARWIGKTDDDCYLHLPNLKSMLHHLLELGSRAHMYAGWTQYASFLPETNQMCGWAPTAKDALAAQRRECRRDFLVPKVIRRHTPFSPYVAPCFPHMSEIIFSSQSM